MKMLKYLITCLVNGVCCIWFNFIRCERLTFVEKICVECEINAFWSNARYALQLRNNYKCCNAMSLAHIQGHDDILKYGFPMW